MGISALLGGHFDLLTVGVAVAGIVLLGYIIYFNNRESLTNKTFLAFSILTALWGISNYLEYSFTTPAATLWALRVHLFLSTLHAFFFFQLAYVFPNDEYKLPAWYRFTLIPIVAMTAILTLTPLVFSGVAAVAPPGEVTNPERGPGIAIFSGTAFGLLLMGLYLLGRKAVKATLEKRRQTLFVAVGMALTAFLILIFNVVLPVIFNILGFIPFAALFVLPFLALISYAIYRHHLFNLKVAATAFLGFMVTIFTFANIMYSTSLSAVTINVTAFIVVLLGSIRIVKDTLELKKLTEELSETNERQEGLIHFIGHEVKGFLTKDEGAFAALDQGDFGQLSPELKPFVERALAETRAGVESVTSILKASNLKKGTTVYKKEPFDLAEVARELVERSRGGASAKGLALTLSPGPTEPLMVLGDKAEISEHVLRNMIDNAIVYTPQGSVSVSARREGSAVTIAVTDTGIGIDPEDKKRLFTEGGHGKDSQTTNAHSTGYGLYIAREVARAHGGDITATSEGRGKGSTFTLRIPLTSSSAAGEEKAAELRQ